MMANDQLALDAAPCLSLGSLVMLTARFRYCNHKFADLHVRARSTLTESTLPTPSFECVYNGTRGQRAPEAYPSGPELRLQCPTAAYGFLEQG